jgi:hypothetical protein
MEDLRLRIANGRYEGTQVLFEESANLPKASVERQSELYLGRMDGQCLEYDQVERHNPAKKRLQERLPAMALRATCPQNDRVQ